jgi:NADH-quinone oxidoreductase subunit L
MFELVVLIPALPLLGFIALALWGYRFPRFLAAGIGVGSIGIGAILAIVVGIRFIQAPPSGHAYSLELWQWMNVAGFATGVTLYLDALSLIMMLVVTVVGFLIHLYSAGYMIDDESYSRFFAYMNLFVFSMLMLVLADNLLLLYLGWEGVGLCSYLLIGFWYREPENVAAANKAFIVTRVGDTAMAIGLFLLFYSFGTLNIQAIMASAPNEWQVGSTTAILAAALLLGGALGKSAQLPLQTWLPDAMAGPTPVSALIHAATMVTAGVYLIARTNVLFQLAPPVQFVVALIGVLTLLIAGCSALVQSDIKKVLAYSTISQIGYMFLALGVGAWSAAMFHFASHACFKSLLFLGAGAVMLSHGHERNMFKLGGLRSQIPVTFYTFLIAAASLAALPLITGGFYSKDLIIWFAWASPQGSWWLWAGAVLGALITALYAFRMVFLTFMGEAKKPIAKTPGSIIHVPLIVLAVMSIAIGFLQTPETLGNIHLFSRLLDTALPANPAISAGLSEELTLQIITAFVSLGGILAAYLLFIRKRDCSAGMADDPKAALVHRFWFVGWGFDWLYDRALVRPFVWIARKNSEDIIDAFYTATALTTEAFHRGLSLSQTGRVRNYAVGIAIGAVVIIGIVVVL